MKNSGKMLAKAAKTITTKNVNSACFGWLYQPKVSEKLQQLKKN